MKLDYDQFFRLSNPEHMEYLKNSPFRGKLFRLFENTGIVNRCYHQWIDLYNIIKDGWWVTAYIDHWNAGRYQISHKYKVNDQYRFRTTSLGGGMYGNSSLDISDTDIMEYFQENPDDCEPIIPHNFPDAPRTGQISYDIFKHESEKLIGNLNKYLNPIGIMGIKTLYKNLNDRDKMKCTHIMDQIIKFAKEAQIPEFIRL